MSIVDMDGLLTCRFVAILADISPHSSLPKQHGMQILRSSILIRFMLI